MKPPPVLRMLIPTPTTAGPVHPPSTTTDDDLQAAQIELMHSIARLAVAAFATNLVQRAQDAQLHEFANIIADATHDYIETGRHPS